MDCINDVGRRGSQLASLLRSAGLHDNGMNLGQASDVQRPAHGEEPALVVQHVHLGFIEEPAGLLVEGEGILLPAVPETLHHLDELGGSRVARVVVHVLLAIEILGLGLGP